MTVSNSANVKENRLAVYIDGIKIPSVKVSVSVTANKPASARILLPPDTMLMHVYCQNILVRGCVHIFYWDFERWNMIFEGEVAAIGHQQNKTGQNPIIVIDAVDMTNYWNFIKVGFFVADKPETWKTTGGLATMSIAPFSIDDDLLRTIAGGGFHRATNLVWSWVANKGGEKQQFYRQAVLRYKLSSKLVIDENPRIKGMAGGAAFKRMIGNSIGSLSQGGSLASMFYSLFKYTHYRYLANPVSYPYYHTGSNHALGTGGALDAADITKGSNGRPPTWDRFGRMIDPGGGGATGLPAGAATFGSMFFLPVYHFRPPIACNVLLPMMITDFSYQRDIMNEITRMRISVGNTTFGLNTKWLRKGFTFYPRHIRNNIKTSLDFYVQQMLPEETIKGVVSESQTSDASGNNPMASEFWKTRTASQFYLRKYGNRRAEASGPVNIFALPGLPIAVIDKQGLHVLGMLQGVSHDIDAKGGGGTRYVISEARSYHEGAVERPGILDHDKYNDDWGKGGDKPASPWKEDGSVTPPDPNEAYCKIGKNVYPFMSGFSGVSSLKQVAGLSDVAKRPTEQDVRDDLASTKVIENPEYTEKLKEARRTWKNSKQDEIDEETFIARMLEGVPKTKTVPKEPSLSEVRDELNRRLEEYEKNASVRDVQLSAVSKFVSKEYFKRWLKQMSEDQSIFKAYKLIAPRAKDLAAKDPNHPLVLAWKLAPEELGDDFNAIREKINDGYLMKYWPKASEEPRCTPVKTEYDRFGMPIGRTGGCQPPMDIADTDNLGRIIRMIYEYYKIASQEEKLELDRYLRDRPTCDIEYVMQAVYGLHKSVSLYSQWSAFDLEMQVQRDRAEPVGDPSSYNYTQKEIPKDYSEAKEKAMRDGYLGPFNVDIRRDLLLAYIHRWSKGARSEEATPPLQIREQSDKESGG